MAGVETPGRSLSKGRGSQTPTTRLFKEMGKYEYLSQPGFDGWADLEIGGSKNPCRLWHTQGNFNSFLRGLYAKKEFAYVVSTWRCFGVICLSSHWCE